MCFLGLLLYIMLRLFMHYMFLGLMARFGLQRICWQYHLIHNTYDWKCILLSVRSKPVVFTTQLLLCCIRLIQIVSHPTYLANQWPSSLSTGLRDHQRWSMGNKLLIVFLEDWLELILGSSLWSFLQRDEWLAGCRLTIASLSGTRGGWRVVDVSQSVAD